MGVRPKKAHHSGSISGPLILGSSQVASPTGSTAGASRAT